MRKVFEKPCKFCGVRIAIAKRAVGDGYDAIDLDEVPVQLRGTSPRQRVLVEAWTWELDALIEQIQISREIPIERANAIARDDFEWRTKHWCPRKDDDNDQAATA